MSDITAYGNKSEYSEINIARELANILNDALLTTIEVKDGCRKIKLVCDTNRTNYQAQLPSKDMTAIDLPSPLACEPRSVNANNVIRAPIVGKVQLGSFIDGTPFVCRGQKVSIGDTLLVIEAMKVKNPISAYRSGIVGDILVGDGSPVEYDQPLMVIE